MIVRVTHVQMEGHASTKSVSTSASVEMAGRGTIVKSVSAFLPVPYCGPNTFY